MSLVDLSHDRTNLISLKGPWKNHVNWIWGNFDPHSPYANTFPQWLLLYLELTVVVFWAPPPFPLIFSRGLYTTPKSSSSDRQEVTTYEKSYEETLKGPFKKLKLSLLQVSIIHILFAISSVWFLSLTTSFISSIYIST